MANTQYEDFVRQRITELRIKKDVSEHRMSLDLDKSGAYIRLITNGMALPSLKELFNIIQYFEMTPAEFFSPLEDQETEYHKICERLRHVSDDVLDKVNTFIDWVDTQG